ncbi:hypothetical protein CTI12_AA528650 [Artemisia annua]|uniref:Uncharacterized protein n=1 Tax=Artemisia annua TaxID=35608 RepID=A0A2U1L5A4_ARTAN|nr:hypothetical protein CTI12_AA528650 [Artemisia annua]
MGNDEAEVYVDHRFFKHTKQMDNDEDEAVKHKHRYLLCFGFLVSQDGCLFWAILVLADCDIAKHSRPEMVVHKSISVSNSVTILMLENDMVRILKLGADLWLVRVFTAFLKPPQLEQATSILLLSDSQTAFRRTLVCHNHGNYKGQLMLSLKQG